MKITLYFFLSSLYLLTMGAAAEDVTYDGRSLFIHGRRHLIISASIHYPRSVPEMWPELVRLAKEGGANTIETYVFWNGHEIAPDVYNFEGRFDLVKFVKIVQEAGLFMILRIGPFVAGEWNLGGVPVWLHFIPETFFRTDNNNYKYYMEKFMTYIVNLMKQEKLFASQAKNGPIIMAQVENEYDYLEQVYPEGKKYVTWAGQMAVSQQTGVPWIMCRESDAPDPIINTCNDYYCDEFQPSSDKPKIWTENWTGWLPTFWAPNFHRPSRDSAFAVARFFQKGGSVMNYYMYHGGTNFGRTGGGGFTTSYDLDGPIDEYGIVRFPKWGHLKELHEAIKLCENVILSTDQPTNIAFGPSQEASVWGDPSSEGDCVAFLANSDSTTDATVVFRNASYDIPAWSVSILPDCKNVVFNTAKVSSQSSVVEMVAEDLKTTTSSSSPEECGGGNSSSSNPLEWEVFVEKAGIWGEKADLVYDGLVDQLNVTKDASDYLWYTTSIDDVDANEEFVKNGSQLALVIQSQSHHLYAFANGELLNKGSATGDDTKKRDWFGLAGDETMRLPIALKVGRNEISIFNTNVGLPSAGPFYEWIHFGPTNVKLEGFNNGTVIDLSTSKWSYKIGLEGEKLEIYKPESTYNVAWNVPSEVPKMQPLTWYKVTVEEPTGDDPIGLDMLNMRKGFAWLNGKQIGRYWLQRSGEHERCVSHGEACDYRGVMVPEKCRTGCGKPTQRWYHIPRSWFKPCDNLLVIFEEEGGDPTTINFSKRRTSRVCAFVAEDHPPPGKATVSLKCPRKNTNISAIEFASFGTPTGNCGSFQMGDCHNPNSLSVVEKACLGKKECVIPVSEENFNKGESTSSSTKMRLAVEAACS